MARLVRRHTDLSALMEVPDSVAASVVWRNEKLFGIVATRRGDGAAAALEVPSDRAGDFNSLNLEAIFRNAMMLDRLVQWALLVASVIDFGGVF